MVEDKHGHLANLATRPRVVLELGCGRERRIRDAVTVDRIDLDTVDVIAELNDGLPFLPDDSVDEIHSYHFLEHVSDLGLMMREIERVLKPGGRKVGSVPHFSNPYFYSDHTHTSAFGLYSFSYFSSESPFRRAVPRYYGDCRFEIVHLELGFDSPWNTRRRLKRPLQWLVNLSRSCQEFYEENLCWILPAYELRFELRKPV